MVTRTQYVSYMLVSTHTHSFRSGSDLILLLILSFSCGCWGGVFSSKNLWLDHFRSNEDFDRNVPHVNTHQLAAKDFRFESHFLDGGHDIISCRKVLQSGELT